MGAYFVIPANRENAFRNAYLNYKIKGKRRGRPPEDEAAGVMVPNADGSKKLTHSWRITVPHRVNWRGRKPPWLEIYDTYEDLIASGWQFPVIEQG